MTSTYVFGHTWDPERARLGGLEWALDPGTEAILDAVGVDPAWRCLEAGAGTGTTASWVFRRVVTSWLGVLQGLAGVRLTLGRELPRRMRAAGLVDVGAQARTPFLTGATPLATGFLRLGIAKVREPMLAGGAVTTEDLAAVDGLLDDPAFDALFLTTVAAQGRRP